MKQKEVTLYEYIFSDNKLYKVEHLCRETEKMYIHKDAKVRGVDQCFIKQTAIRLNQFNATNLDRILKVDLDQGFLFYNGQMIMVSLDSHAETKAMQAFEVSCRKKVDDAYKMYQEACVKWDECNRAYVAIIKESIVKTPEALYDKVLEEYRNHDVMLNSLHFDFLVRMPKRDILNTYATIQDDVNGDLIVRIENGTRKDPLVPDTPEFDEIYDGNCKDFLESFNKDARFHRFCEGNTDIEIDFIG